MKHRSDGLRQQKQKYARKFSLKLCLLICSKDSNMTSDWYSKSPFVWM